MKNFKYLILYIFGGVIMITSLVLFVINIFHLVSTVDSRSTRFVAPGSCETKLEKDEKYIIYYEYQSTFDGKIYSTSNVDISGLGVVVTNIDTNKKIDIRSSAISSSYNINGRAGTSMFELKVDEPMNVVVVSKYIKKDGPEVILNISPDITSDMFIGMGEALGFIGIGFLGLIIIIVTIIMHVRTKQRYHKER